MATTAPRRRAPRRRHRHSAAAFARLGVAEREALILSAYRLGRCPMTDREVAKAIGFDDLNACRPRITEMRDRRWLREVGETKCPVSGITVRICMPTAKAPA